jgi:hypothetical protein
MYVANYVNDGGAACVACKVVTTTMLTAGTTMLTLRYMDRPDEDLIDSTVTLGNQEMVAEDEEQALVLLSRRC